MRRTYDVIVVGSGTGGQTAARMLKDYGLSVAVIEHSEMPGGICALAGCQAKKWYYEAAETMARSRHLAGKGVSRQPEMDWSCIRDEKRSFTRSVPEATRKGLRGAGIDLIEGRAAFRDETALVVNGESVSAKYIILATGAHPMALPFTGAEHLVDSSAFLELDHLPSRVAFVGGGFISFEFAHFAAFLGPAENCHIIEAASRPLGAFDAEMVEQLIKASRAEGISIHTDVKVSGIEKDKSGYVIYSLDGKGFNVDMVVHGAGRTPSLEGLELEEGNVAYTRRGITVDSEMRTSNQRVFAVGDCAATIQLARVADYEACVAAKNILSEMRGDDAALMDYRAVSAVLFTYPQYAMVGATEESLKTGGIPYYKSMDSNLSWPTYRRIGMRHAAYKVLVDENSRVLGAHIISDNAAGLINIFRQAIISGQSVADLYWNHVMTPYPTRESDITYMLAPFLADDLLEGL
ncbi:MAG: NAD(P)/FAD-dependent oxidoreductase [Desulfosalsimonadaceae bacterium]